MVEFGMDKALAAAVETLPDRRVLDLDDAQWSALMAVLDAPVAYDPRLHALLAREPAWERRTALTDSDPEFIALWIGTDVSV